MHSSGDTIAAIATAAGEAGICIVRISGPAAFAVADRVFQCRGAPPSQRPGGTFVHGRVVANGETIDDALCLIMRAPHSYTGEDTAELHGHGGSVQARRLLACVLQAGARPANPGEFTQRAFLNGRLDLAQAEAVLDTIRARSDRAAAAAIEQLEGGLSRSLNALYDKVVALAADLEATLDFPEDELPEAVLAEVCTRIGSALTDTDALLATWNEGHLLRDGALVVIAGRPNAGKSTLLNTLLGRDRAIVSPIPGTTRDVIEETAVIDGIPLRLVDTAGIRDAACEIEREGIRRSKSQLERADIFIYVVDASELPHPDDLTTVRGLDASRTILVINKIDKSRQFAWPPPAPAREVETCLKDGRGLSGLREAILELLGAGLVGRGHGAAISERHRTLLLSARARLSEALGLLQEDRTDAPALAASHLRLALEEVGRTTGRVYETELLDAIFSRFCIGK